MVKYSCKWYYVVLTELYCYVWGKTFSRLSCIYTTGYLQMQAYVVLKYVP